MGYYAEAERAYDPDEGPVSRWKKRDTMRIADIKKILEDFIEEVTAGGKDFKWCGSEFGAPVALRLSQPGTPTYESASISLAGQPGYGEESVLKVQLSSYSIRYYLVDLTDVEKLQKQLDEIAGITYNRLTSWDDEQAAYDPEEDPFEPEEEEPDFSDRDYERKKDEELFGY